MLGLRSLGLKTDLLVPSICGEVHDRGAFISVRTPSNPGFIWGNFLVFRSPPEKGDLPRWEEAFRSEFSELPEVRHQAFTWDEPGLPRPVPPEFTAAGFEVEPSSVLTASRLRPAPHPNKEVHIRPLASAPDWEAATRNQIRCRGEGWEAAAYGRFKLRQMHAYRTVAEAGHGSWFGAFVGRRLVGDLGIFKVGGLGRYQSVGTDPDYRRRGVCAALVHAAGRHALEKLGSRTLVILSGPGSAADRVYRSLGLRPTQSLVGVFRLTPRPQARTRTSQGPAG
ncbi:MAG: GNAT family N-acetyltransferase [Elusimicrobia bacterium]|nr:GNAT family N-acetyltransferase [Elusimicrobiota bacterium]